MFKVCASYMHVCVEGIYLWIYNYLNYIETETQ